MSVRHSNWIHLPVTLIMCVLPISNGDCHEPLAPKHGSISFADTEVGSMAAQLCDQGFRMNGVSVITCLEDNLWSHPPVTCTQIECPEPVVPENGSIRFAGTEVGATAEQSCNTGYKMSGVKVITCLEDSLWSHPPVTCTLIETKKCRWSNEGCSLNDDCCSGSCVQQHEGTDPRCEKSAIHFPCFYSYQCEDGLACGNQYSCCSPFWGVCSDNGDCCEMKHVCRPEEGFIYKRCLMPSRSNMVFLSRQFPVVLATMHIIYYVY